MKPACNYIAILLMLVITASCSKKTQTQTQAQQTQTQQTQTQPTCHLTSINTVGPNYTKFDSLTYNADGRLYTISATGLVGEGSVFTYSGDTITMDQLGWNYSLLGRYTITLDSFRHIASVVETNKFFYLVYAEQFSYDSNGHLMQTASQQPTITSNVQYTNGDVTTVISSDGTTNNYTYYTDKAFADGDFLKIQQLTTYGALYIENSHLVKTRTICSSVDSFSYEFDSSSRITKSIQTNGANTTTYSYGYTCQ